MSADLPAIPEKLYFTIGEVGLLCDLRPHVLRYWEQEFPHLSPTKRRGNRRYYQRKDVVLVRKIKSLLYDQGYTIDGARQKLSAVESGKSDGDADFQKLRDLMGVAVVGLEKVLVGIEGK